MLTTVSVQEAKMHLSRLLERVGEREEIIIAKDGRPLAGWFRQGRDRSAASRGAQWARS
ncbi:hypothetical protein BH24ACT21_BH24ACT21_17180 [soil metagenome]